jgi:hypothetical protein
VTGNVAILGTNATTSNILYFENNTPTPKWHIQMAGSGLDFVETGVNDRMFIQAGGNVGIGTTSPNANAILDVASTTKAFMPPRMTTTQRDNIASPTEGMVIFNITTHVLNYYGTAAWAAV